MIGWRRRRGVECGGVDRALRHRLLLVLLLLRRRIILYGRMQGLRLVAQLRLLLLLQLGVVHLLRRLRL